MKNCGPRGSRCSRSGDYVVECENHAAASGSWWWWSLSCIPDWEKTWVRLHGEWVTVADAQAMQAGVVTLRAAQRMQRQ